jgi:hypothetical protein
MGISQNVLQIASNFTVITKAFNMFGNSGQQQQGRKEILEDIKSWAAHLNMHLEQCIL